MKVLVACEFSGTVRDAFIRHGHDALSCDLLPTDIPGPHYKGDVRDVVSDNWDLMIAHPPCTYLAVSGARWWSGRLQEQADALQFVQYLLGQDHIPRVALENPIGKVSTAIRKPDQVLQPWQFGHPESKATCLWLKGLPILTPTGLLAKPEHGWSNTTPSGQNKLSPSPDRWKLRSKTYLGIAEAMASQWA